MQQQAQPESRHAMRRVVVLALTLGLIGACQPATPRDAPQPGSGVVDLPIARGFERVLYRQPDNPAAVVVLLAGGDGVLALDGTGHSAPLGGNFLLRTRDEWIKRGLAVAIPDAPSDRSIRMGAGDPVVLRAIIADVRTHTEAPIWLIGTSVGTVRAAYGAAHLGAGEIAGLVLTSSTSRPGGHATTDTVFSVGLDRVAVPTLIVSHAGDRCFVTPPSDAESIQRALSRAPKTEIMRFEGGRPPVSGECEGGSEHGYFGIEARVLDRIGDWIKAQSS
jgi:hypothetical protein